MNVNSCVGISCPTISKNTVTSNSFKSGLGSTSTTTLSILGSKLSIVISIWFCITDAVQNLRSQTDYDRMSEPSAELKISLGIVCTKFLTDFLIASSFLRIVRSFVTGCGVKDKLMSLNALDIRFLPLKQVFPVLFMTLFLECYFIYPKLGFYVQFTYFIIFLLLSFAVFQK